MGTDILLSVIIPYYNGKKYIKELLDSILQITIEQMEIIIVDDGSKEEDAMFLKQILKKDTRIISIKQENMGIVGARNSGLSYAKGEYLLFCDQDDKVNPFTIKTIVFKMLEQKADIGFYSTKHFNNRGNEWECDTVYEEGIYTDRQVADIFLRKLITRYAREREVISYIGHLWGCIISRHIVNSNDIKFKRFMSIEDDLLFVLDVLDNAKCVVTTVKTGYYWRGNQTSMTRSAPYIEHMADKMKKYYRYRTEILKKHEICDEKEMSNYFIGMKQEYMLNYIFNEVLLGFKNYTSIKKSIQNELADLTLISAIQSEANCPFAHHKKIEMYLLSKKHLNALIIECLYKAKIRKIKFNFNNYFKKVI